MSGCVSAGARRLRKGGHLNLAHELKLLAFGATFDNERKPSVVKFCEPLDVLGINFWRMHFWSVLMVVVVADSVQTLPRDQRVEGFQRTRSGALQNVRRHPVLELRVRLSDVLHLCRPVGSMLEASRPSVRVFTQNWKCN